MVKPVICVCSTQFQYGAICSFIDLMRQAPKYHRINVVDSTLLPYARNKLVRMTYEVYPDFTHIIFVDDDMCGYLEEHFDALIQADKPIVSALVTTRRPPYQMVNSFPNMPPEQILQHIENMDILQSDLVGMAFTCIKREVFDATGEKLLEGNKKADGDILWFTMDRSPRVDFEDEVENLINEAFKHKDELDTYLYRAVALGQNSHLGTPLVGEDCAFVRKAKTLSFKSYVHMGVLISHLGTKECNIKDSIKYRIEREIAYAKNLTESQSLAVID